MPPKRIAKVSHEGSEPIMNIVGEEVEEVEDSATVKHKEYDV